MPPVRFPFGVLGLGIFLTFAGASSAGAQCAASACAGTADCSVNAASGVDVAGCCTTATPCATIQFAVGQVSAGAVIKVAPGTYPENAASTLNIHKTVTLCGANAGTDARGARAAESIITNARGPTESARHLARGGS